MIKILVFPAGTEIAFEIHSALKYCKFIELYGGTSVPCHANFVFKNCIDGLPFVDNPKLVAALNEVVDKYDIDFIYPAHDSVLLKLTQASCAGKLKAKVITSPLKTVEITRSKLKTYEYLGGAFYLPKTYASADEVKEYPVFAKHAVGQGGEGAIKVTSRDTLELILRSGIEYAICEYLPGPEITVDCFTDRHGELRFVNPRTRDRIRSGIAVRSHRAPYTEQLKLIANDLNSRFQFNGAWFFQMKEDKDGQLKLMEVAPRIAGTMGLSRNLGVNLPLLTVYNMLGEDVDILSNDNEILLDRAFISRFEQGIKYDRIYVDFDDTLVVKGEVNTFLLAFLIRAKADGKQIVLLTRHVGDIYWALLEAGVDRWIFDRVLNIASLKGKHEKYEFVTENSIFIDDSFAERKKVHDNCGIPVFDLDAVESLFDWRA